MVSSIFHLNPLFSYFSQPQLLILSNRSVQYIMSQRSITSFFNKGPKRSLASGDEKDIPDVPSEKKPKTDDVKTNGFSLREEIEKQVKATPALSLNIGETWFKALKPEFDKQYFKDLSSFLSVERKQHTIFPPVDQVFTWTRFTSIQDIKVVIIGQDPYHGVNQAHGLSFSVRKGVPAPPSLKNIFLELQKDIPGFKAPFHGDLSGWAEQGVLMLNTCLTVRSNNANSHSGRGWEKLTDACIKWISKNLEGVVFILWGSHAQKKKELIDGKRHLVHCSAHPSPLSAHRGFFGSKPFSTANQYLKKNGKDEVDWKNLP